MKRVSVSTVVLLAAFAALAVLGVIALTRPSPPPTAAPAPAVAPSALALHPGAQRALAVQVAGERSCHFLFQPCVV